MKIKVDRQSVCMGDDVLPHLVDYEIAEASTVYDFVNCLKKDYLPHISGNNVAWGLMNNGTEFAVYFTQKDLVTNSSLVMKDIIKSSKDSLIYHLS